MSFFFTSTVCACVQSKNNKLCVGPDTYRAHCRCVNWFVDLNFCVTCHSSKRKSFVSSCFCFVRLVFSLKVPNLFCNFIASNDNYFLLQVWSEIDHASPSTSECVPPLERTESVFVSNNINYLPKSVN